MARKIQKKPGPRPGQPAGAAAKPSELEILHPERTLPIAGRMVTVREYGYIEGLHLLTACKPFLDSLYALFERASATPPTAYEISEVVIAHVQIVRWLMAQAITPAPGDDADAFATAIADNAKWVGTLGRDDGDLLMLAWWGANVHFFMNRLRLRAVAAKSPSTQAGSTPP